MKKIIEKIILLGFILFCAGGILKVLLQTIGLLLLNSCIIDLSMQIFSWIYPLAALTGLACYVMSYSKKKTSE